MKQNGVVCWPGPALLFFKFRFEHLISGPKSYRDFRETSLSGLSLDIRSVIRSLYKSVNRQTSRDRQQKWKAHLAHSLLRAIFMKDKQDYGRVSVEVHVSVALVTDA